MFHFACRSLTFTLQKRLPSDRVSGTFSLTVTNNSVGPEEEEGEGEGGGGGGAGGGRGGEGGGEAEAEGGGTALGVVSLRVSRPVCGSLDLRWPLGAGRGVAVGGEERIDTLPEAEAMPTDQAAISNESPLPTSSQAAESAARQPHGDVPSIVVGEAAETASFPMRKQLSDDPQIK